MKQGIFEITGAERAAKNTYIMRLRGDCSEITRPGQFVNILLDGLYLRRPISVCDLDGDCLTLGYKAVGRGTEKMASMRPGERLDILTGLGNGYAIEASGRRPALCAGGAGTPPMLWLCRELLRSGREPGVFLGFNSSEEIFLANELSALGVRVRLATLDGSVGVRGFVTDAMAGEDFDYIFACGPEPMLRAVYNATEADGQFSFEERMGCGFGACMGCSCKTKYGHKRVCRDGPVLKRDEIVW